MSERLQDATIVVKLDVEAARREAEKLSGEGKPRRERGQLPTPDHSSPAREPRSREPGDGGGVSGAVGAAAAARGALTVRGVAGAVVRGGTAAGVATVGALELAELALPIVLAGVKRSLPHYLQAGFESVIEARASTAVDFYGEAKAEVFSVLPAIARTRSLARARLLGGGDVTPRQLFETFQESRDLEVFERELESLRTRQVNQLLGRALGPVLSEAVRAGVGR